MIRKNIDSPILLSTLWIFILFNTIFRDLHEFLNHEFLEELMVLRVTDLELLFYGFVLEIPIAMVLLSRILSNKAVKRANIFAASIVLFGAFSTLPSADIDDVFFTMINSLALIAIILVAWGMPVLKDTQLQTEK